MTGFSGDGQRFAFLAAEPTTKAENIRQQQGFIQEIYEEDQSFVRVYVCTLGGTADETGDLTKMIRLEGSASEVHFQPDGG